ncbi:MAG: imidazoleglycerol-phosphate dehydratase HisB [Candidatus Kerfeldbacteria bacterium]|nr:imidazoleglycerol-phosphate dehydratase HisB [Candidatus Kerfeldbacteria bacterium]
MKSAIRTARVKRQTTETDVTVKLNLDGTGKYQIDTGIGFFDHMLELFAKHSLIDLTIVTQGDLNVDEHHTVEDTGIVLGMALAKALGNKRGIERYGFMVPMDETLAEVALDLSGRSYLVWNVQFSRDQIGDMPTELFEHFFKSLADYLQANIHIHLRYGQNSHHQAEAIFKAFARALRIAVRVDQRTRLLVPSTKGRL